jgi:hypothetical protein
LLLIPATHRSLFAFIASSHVNKIRSSIFCRHMQTKPETGGMQHLSDRDFQLRILTTNPAHIPRPSCFIEMIGHAEVTRLETDASVALTVFEVIYHGLDDRCHAGDMILTDTEDGFSIQVEIVVGDNIPHTFGTFPVH